VKVIEIQDPEVRSLLLCHAVLHELPDRFGFCGFVPLEEIPGLWEWNPCLLMVKRL
jgi:hypothetical protein